MSEDTSPQEAADADADDLEVAADRLEAALDRIERRLRGLPLSITAPARVDAELAARLDGLIWRLREALNRSASAPAMDLAGGYSGGPTEGSAVD
jgi:hypothetical protein